MHPTLRKILDADAYLTEKFVLYANQFLPLRSLRIHYRALEVMKSFVLYFFGLLSIILDYLSWNTVDCILDSFYVAF